MKTIAKILGVVALLGSILVAAKILIDLFYNKCDESYFACEEIE